MPDGIKIRRALISVYDKTGIVEFARALHEEFKIEILSTGGTAKTLRDAGIPVVLIEDLTGFPELLDGRVKTLHPKIHAAILADRDNPEHLRQLREHGIEPIDLVVVNLYPFEKTVADPNCTFEQAIEMIDIGGVTLLRAAAKNHRHVLLISSPHEYSNQLHFLRKFGNHPEFKDWQKGCAFNGFRSTATYDSMIASWLGYTPNTRHIHKILLQMPNSLRYGENPHQEATHFLDRSSDKPVGFHTAFSYNNIVDADAALGLCAELTRAAEKGHRLLACATKPAESRVEKTPGKSADASRDLGNDRREMWHRLIACAEPAPVGAFPEDKYRAIEEQVFTRRNLPHLQRPGATYFVTFRTHQGTLTPAERDLLMECCLFQDRKMYCLHAAVVMPDHAHLLLTPLEADPGQYHSLAKIMHSIKGNAGRKVADLRGRPGPVLQDESFDHIVRNHDDFWETLEYIYTNPTRARLDSGGPYPWCAFEPDPEWDARAGSAFADPQHMLRAEEQGRGTRPWHRLLACATIPTAVSAEKPTNQPAESATCVFIKHTNPCGVGIADNPLEAYRRAYLGDPNAAMGGILACNFEIDADFAAAVMETFDLLGKPLKDAGAPHAPGGFFVEVWIAPAFSEDAVAVIRGTAAANETLPNPPKKKWGENVRLLAVGDMSAPPDPNELQYRSIAGGMLVQTPDLAGLNEEQWKVVTQRQPTEQERNDLRLAWLICKHTKSNAISIVKDGTLLGNGAGQMSRVMSCRIATWLARENGHADALAGAVAASDAFFPFHDGPNILIDAGVTALIQPGGSKRDEDTIKACDERGVAMIFTGTRHFKH